MSLLTSFILAFGYIGIFVAIFAESGFFLGFFFPGDSLLFSVGLLAASGSLSLVTLIPLAIIAAIAGDSFGYWMGTAFGRRFFERHTGRFLKREYLEDTDAFFARHGRLAVFLARFVPVVRTFTPILAGIGEMKYRVFIVYNIIGGVVWAGGFLLLSYYLGHITVVRQYTSFIIIFIVIVSVLPLVIGWLRAYIAKRTLPHE